jgi:hypothetical protein
VSPRGFGGSLTQVSDDVRNLSYQFASVSASELMPQFARSRFDHIGLVTDDVKPGESWVEATRVWVTSPREHPFHVEWLRFEPDSPVTGPLRTEPHVAYRVDDVHAAIEGLEVLAEPFDVGNGFLTVAFVIVDGAVVEFMQYANPNEEGWF